jgi:hypothetical protein
MSRAGLNVRETREAAYYPPMRGGGAAACRCRSMARAASNTRRGIYRSAAKPALSPKLATLHRAQKRQSLASFSKRPGYKAGKSVRARLEDSRSISLISRRGLRGDHASLRRRANRHRSSLDKVAGPSHPHNSMKGGVASLHHSKGLAPNRPHSKRGLSASNVPNRRKPSRPSPRPARRGR